LWGSRALEPDDEVTPARGRSSLRRATLADDDRRASAADAAADFRADLQGLGQTAGKTTSSWVPGALANRFG